MYDTKEENLEAFERCYQKLLKEKFFFSIPLEDKQLRAILYRMWAISVTPIWKLKQWLLGFKGRMPKVFLYLKPVLDEIEELVRK